MAENTQDQTSYARDFINRYMQLRYDHKLHQNTLRILEGEFRYKFIDAVCLAPTYFFIDNSCADYVGNDFVAQWELHENINNNDKN